MFNGYLYPLGWGLFYSLDFSAPCSFNCDIIDGVLLCQCLLTISTQYMSLTVRFVCRRALLLILLCLGAIRQSFCRCKIEFIIVVTVMSRYYQASFQLV